MTYLRRIMARESFTSARAKVCPMQFLEKTGNNMRYLLSGKTWIIQLVLPLEDW